MGKMKEIYMDTLEEVKDLTSDELKSLVIEKNVELNHLDENLDELSDNELIRLISEKNLLLVAKEIGSEFKNK